MRPDLRPRTLDLRPKTRFIPSHRSKVYGLWSMVLMGLLLLPMLSWGEKERPLAQEEKLKTLQKELQKEREKAEAMTQKERSLAQELSQIELKLQRKGEELKALEAKLKGSKEGIERLSKEIAKTGAELEKTKAFLAQRLRVLYKQGGPSSVRLLLSSEDLSKMGRRLKYLSSVAYQDQRIISSYVQTLAALRDKREELERQKAELKLSQDLAEERRREILEEKERRRILLAKVREEKAQHLANVRELDRASKELQALIARLREEGLSKRVHREDRPLGDGSVFAALKGKLPWPTRGTLNSTFGRKEHPRFKTVTFNKGIEISAPKGRDVVAVHDGTVLYADWFKGYGRLLILDHGGGYFTLYAHASDLLVRVGDQVKRGQVIAQVGDSGSLDGPLLYFELRYKGKPQDPLVWLEPK